MSNFKKYLEAATEDKMSYNSQRDLLKRLKKELGLKELPVYFDHVDMVDGDSSETIFKGALNGEHTYQELKNFIVKRYKLKSNK